MIKERFGAFLAVLRKEKGLTQRALAERLYVSDKAVSKWERGLSLPDVALLTPLSEALGVGVAELLRGERAERPLETAEVDALVSGALHLGREEELRWTGGKRGGSCPICSALWPGWWKQGCCWPRALGGRRWRRRWRWWRA